MIEAFIDHSGFTIRGHAEYEERGKDIVCAGVSALTQTIAIMLERECNATTISTHEVLFVAFENYQIKEKLLMSTLITGLQKIENDFPGHIKLNIKKGMI